MAELVMDVRIVWDARKLKQVDEAKKEYRKYRSLGYQIFKLDGTPLERFLPSLEEIVVRSQGACQRVLKILCPKGDERVVWDKEDGPQALQAKAKFVELLSKGYMAFSVDSKGKKNRKIEEFDVDAEEILMIPPTSKG